MNSTGTGISASLLFHGSLIALFMLLSAAVEREHRPIAVDLGLLAPAGRSAPSSSAPARPKRMPAVQPPSASPDAAPSPDNMPPDIQEAVSPPGDRSSDVSERDMNGPGNGATDTKGMQQAYLNEYFMYIRDRIVKNLFFPPAARSMGWSGRVSVSFVICRDGRVEQVRIVQSTGFEVLDRNVIAAIKRSSPFPVPPVEAELFLPIVYKLL